MRLDSHRDSSAKYGDFGAILTLRTSRSSKKNKNGQRTEYSNHLAFLVYFCPTFPPARTIFQQKTRAHKSESARMRKRSIKTSTHSTHLGYVTGLQVSVCSTASLKRSSQDGGLGVTFGDLLRDVEEVMF